MIRNIHFFICIAGTLATGCALPGITADYDANSVGGGTNGGATHTGGSAASAGNSNVGGRTSGGGANSVGGATSVGGTSPQGGTKSAGGATPVGGSTSNGGAAGAVTTGGALAVGGGTGTGGATAIGGQPNTGGSKSVGGTANVAGSSSVAGSPATGGIANTGGSKPAGGATSTGGSKTAGGTPSTGGAPSTGGLNATGGTPSTGGTMATGGSSSSTLVATAVAAGYSHACALVQDGTILCWGNNTDGELGNGATVDGTEIISTVPVKVLNVSQAVSIATGDYHTCAVLSSGVVQCWGWNGEGELGNGKSGSSSRYSVPANVKVDGVNDLTNVASVVGGATSTCAVLKDGSVKCWGDNSYNQLGNGNNNSTTIPVQVVNATMSPLSQITKMALQDSHACAIQTGGSLYCWGYNAYGQLGNKSTTTPLTAVQAIGVQATAVGVGEFHTCAITNAGAVQCWGRGSYYGELGDGSMTDSLTPLTAQTSTTASAIGVGTSFSCAVLNGSGKIECWGANAYGQLGNGSTGDSSTPVAVPALSQAKTVGCGDDFMCAVISGGAVYCWGDNWFGSLGDGTGGHNTQSATPTRVTGF
jgi:alpha-tubulin suppressor-like RCC1 family protein